ncbi:hypothetical protein ACFPM7_28130 [Actinokineospora guangxiensis]|uniref:Uncharacterized protein n=1 Tax=Actinokineospora guangxiensis TaxID=1490288 RepID=A0ABW0EW23_9PSEU
MVHPLDQLYKAKLQLIAVFAVVGGVLCLVAARYVELAVTPGWLEVLPLTEIGQTLFGTGLLAVFFEYVDRKHGDRRTEEHIRTAVRREAPAFRDALLDSLAFDAKTLENVASPQLLDRIATNAMGIRLQDDDLASHLYDTIHDQVVLAPERWRDLRLTISLEPWQNPTPSNPAPAMFVATIQRDYYVRPAHRTLRFASVSDLSEYRELLHDPTVAGQWYFEEVRGLDTSSPDAFSLVQLAVDGKDRPIRRTTRKGAQYYSADLGQAATAGGEVHITYTYRAVVQQRGNLLYLDIPRPTNGLRVQFNYQGTGIQFVNVLDANPSNQRPVILHSPSSAASRSVEVGYDGWVMPGSRLGFVWVLDTPIGLRN